jgi:long-chain fatty acid transport protein
MRFRLRSLTLVSLLATSATSLFAARSAHATGVTEFPDNGSEQFSRGGAWVARASDPLAVYYNPAGLAGQPTKLTLQSNIMFQHTCFQRVRSTFDTSQADPLLAGGGNTYQKYCADDEPNFGPQIAFNYHVSDRLGVGLAVVGPSAAGNAHWPDFVKGSNGDLTPSPTRYLLVKKEGLVVFPTIGAGYEVINGLRLGAALQWGIAKFKLANTALGLNSDNLGPGNDIRANLQVADYFVPGFTLGALYSPTDEIDVAGWYKWSDAIKARGDVGTQVNFYTAKNAKGDSSGVTHGDTIFSDCGTGTAADQTANPCGKGDNATVKIAIPMEAKLGFRYHKTRISAPHVRDPLLTDKFDVEADLTWANNSAADAIQIRFPGDSNGNGLLPVSGIQGAYLPPNADAPTGYRDVFGVRIGGDYNVLPDRLALRAGGFYQSRGQDKRYQNVEFAGAQNFGLALGATYRLRFGGYAEENTKTNAVEFMLGYGHIFYADQDNTNPRAEGFTALAGTSCNPAATPTGGTCPNGQQRYRSNWPINLGTITNQINVINIGASYRF